MEKSPQAVGSIGGDVNATTTQIQGSVIKSNDSNIGLVRGKGGRGGRGGCQGRDGRSGHLN